jgi:hypothetical protein
VVYKEVSPSKRLIILNSLLFQGIEYLFSGFSMLSWYLVPEKFISQSFLNMLSLVTMRMMKLICYLLRSYHLLPSLMILAINLLNLIFNLLLFNLESERTCLNL